jgi:quercetin dioxygenase-like cupin family protein
MSTKNSARTDGPIVPLPMPFIDPRGAIQTLVSGGFHTVQIITSKAGSVRANHYHKTDSHYMYIVSGRMRYVERPVEDGAEPEWTIVSAGQLIFTGPMLEHAVEFLEDTVFLNITSESRVQVDYETDLVRVTLIEPKPEA